MDFVHRPEFYTIVNHNISENAFVSVLKEI
jgi:hypothetical protein